MKKNSTIGFLIIGAILIGFSWYNSKIYNEQLKKQAQIDSIARVKAQEVLEQEALDSASKIANFKDSISFKDSVGIASNNASQSIYKDSLLIMANEASEEFFTLENEKIKITFTNRGAQPYKVEIKNYFTFDSRPLFLVKDSASSLSLVLFTNQEIKTDAFKFNRVESSDSSVIYRLPFDEDSFIEYTYNLSAGSYLVDFNVRLVGMQEHIQKKVTTMDLNWVMDVPRLEKGYDNEKNYSSVLYKHPNAKSVESLGLRKQNAEKDIRTKINWVAFQQQFFSAILISKDNFNMGFLSYKIYPEEDPSKNLMHCEANMQIPCSYGEEINLPFQLYYGPNHYKTLKSYGQGFEKIVPLGGWLIGWINRFIVIPVFDFLSKFISNYGIIILILTLIIKIIISPLTLRSYMSTAKMRVLKPEIDKINAKYPRKEDALKKQQETMALYKKAGVSMFGGCIPVLLQMPILFAMFKFFPASFELRQQSFLWAEDLSGYDSILNLPFRIPLYGDHVSLFALLMAISTYLYSKMNADQMGSGPQMAGMKFMSLYFMPIFLLVLCNNFSSGLSYYYMLSNVLTMLQTWIIRKFFVDEKKLYAKLKEKASSNEPVKKSKFQQRLDEAYKMQQQQLQQQKKRK
ncbi:MAG: membrane protein insertase YidC [Rikenellaceae bacterium]